jgi:hypothetical protein
MTRRTTSIATLAVALLGILATLAPAGASAAPAPAWRLDLLTVPTNLEPGRKASVDGFSEYAFRAINVGGAPTSGPITITDVLPSGLSFSAAKLPSALGANIEAFPCSVDDQTVTCTNPVPVGPGQSIVVEVPVDVSAGLANPSTLDNAMAISGGGAPAASIATTTTISSALPSFDFLPGRPGLDASLTDPSGLPTTEAGSHPGELTVGFNFPLKPDVFPAGTLHDLRVALPPGLVVNPTATPLRCTEVQLEADECPNASQVGRIEVPIVIGAFGPSFYGVYNMAPPPGAPAEFGVYIQNIPLHILGGVRPDDFRLSSHSPDVLAQVAIFNARVQLWGSPTDPSHDWVRGACDDSSEVDKCPVTQSNVPFLTMPTACGDSLPLDADADSWEERGLFHHRSTAITDADGNPTGVAGCGALPFDPSLQARPTTNAADSPSGLSAVLHIPQTDDLDTLATAHLRKAVVTLPEGLVINPSGANGLDGCDSGEVGIDPGTGVANGNTVKCPDASRIGTVEVDTPLLDHPLPGSVFVATPHDNPFDSLLAIYVVVDDPQTGVLIKLAGHVEPDPDTGRLTTTFDNGPQLPFEDFKLEFFGGATAALRTPATCGTYSTTSSLTPWSAPDSGPPATPEDTYAISQGPNGAPCADSPGAMPHTPSFDAGSASAIAGAHAPFVVTLRREDGTQQFDSVSLVPPPGLLAKLAGTPYCSDLALVIAATKTGNQEKADPSCPAASQIGSVEVGAGAGPAPYYATGKAYLAGPYKGAPLSMAIVTPAAAGPYDLGTVVVRTALNVNPETTKITAVSDPIPQILQGIPLDVRSARIALDKPDFTLNPTNCDPLAVSGTLFSSLGQAAALQNRFQVGECGRLAFKPKLALTLKGGTRRGKHPAVRAVLTMPPGSANIKAAQVALPHSEFLDQAHIRTICTRVQFAASQCPAGSVYGRARAITPLLDQPLEGPVYMRSSDHTLPDLVADLNGQIHVVLVGRIDTVNGGIRNSFEGVPDAPVSKFVLEMQGGKKGLLQNSRDLCKSTSRARASFTAQNNKVSQMATPLRPAGCKKGKKGKQGKKGKKAGKAKGRSTK